MRTSVTSLSKKFISTFFAATLALGLVPAAAFADTGEDADNVIPSEAIEDGAVEESAPIEQNEAEGLTTSWEDDQATVIPAASERINLTMTLQTRTVAQAESTRSYFLAQTLESTRTVPIVSANLPLDTSSVDVVEPEAKGEGSAPQEEEGDNSDDDPDADDSVDASFTLASSESDSAVSAESTVIGSFTYLGMTFAVEPGGESVALVAVDYNMLPAEFIQNQVLAIPTAVMAYNQHYYSVTRIADGAFASLTKENALSDYTGAQNLLTDEYALAEAGIDDSEIEVFLNPESDLIDIDGDGEADTPVDPLKDYAGILAVGVPASITSIEDEAFSGFDTLQYLVISEDNPIYASFDGVLYDADLTNLRLIPEGRVGAVRVAPSATAVDPEVFSHCPLVTTLVADPESELNLAVDPLNVVKAREDANVLSIAGLLDELLNRQMRGELTLSAAPMDIPADYSLRSSNGALATYFVGKGMAGSYFPLGTRASYTYDTSKNFFSASGGTTNYGWFSPSVVVDGITYIFYECDAYFNNGASLAVVQNDANGYCIRNKPKEGNYLYFVTWPKAYNAKIVNGSGVLYSGYNIKWDGNGATASGGETGPTTVIKNFPTVTDVPEGMTASGWFEDKSTYTTQGFDASTGQMTVSDNETRTFYLRLTHPMTFYHQDKENQTTTSRTGNLTKSEGRINVQSNVPDPTRTDGWTFRGWAGQSTYDVDKWLVKGLTTAHFLSYWNYYARWGKTVNLNANAATAAVSSPSIALTSSDVAPYGNLKSADKLPTPTRSDGGWIFAGWYGNAACTGDRLDDGTGAEAGYLKLNAVTSQSALYAKWEHDDYTIKWTNGDSTITEVKNYNDTIGLLAPEDVPEASEEGRMNLFEGWTALDGKEYRGNYRVSDFASMATTDNVIEFKAKWNDQDTIDTTKTTPGCYFQNGVTFKGGATLGVAEQSHGPDNDYGKASIQATITGEQYRFVDIYSGLSWKIRSGYDATYGYYAVFEQSNEYTYYAWTEPAAKGVMWNGSAAILTTYFTITWDGNGFTATGGRGVGLNSLWYPMDFVGPDEWRGSGWYEDTSFTTKIHADGTGRIDPPLTKDTTYYMRVVRDLTFNCQDAFEQTVMNVMGIKNYGASVTSVKPEKDVADPTRSDGWDFQGWSTYSDIDSGLFKNPTTATDLTAYTFYGRWAKNLELDSNGGSEVASPMALSSSDKAPYGNKKSDDKLPTPTKTGYFFGGWYADEACAGARVDDGEGNQAGYLKLNAITSQDTIYAKWTNNVSSVAFDANMDGKDSMRKTIDDVAYDDELPGIPTGAAKSDMEGFKFAGYFDANGEQYYLADGTPAKDAWDKAEENVTLYAHWKYKVLFDKNDDEAKASLPAGEEQADGTVKVTLTGGTGSESVFIHDYDSDSPWIWATYHGKESSAKYPTVYLPGATRANYPGDGGAGRFTNLAQWTYDGGTKSVGAGVQLTDQNALVASLAAGSDGVKSVTLTADWAGVAWKYIVRLVASTPFPGGTGADAIEAVQIVNDPSRTKTISNVPYGSLLSAGTPDTTYTGNWKIVVPIPEGSQHVRFAGYYGKTGATDSDFCYVNADGTVNENNCVLDRSSVNEQGEIELYARWEVAVYSVKFELTDAKGTPSVIASQTPDAIENLRHGDAMPDLAWNGSASATGKVPARDGYDFRGYFDENGIQYYKDDLTKVSDDVAWTSAYDVDTLYARWTYDIELDMNLGAAGTTPAKDAVLAADGTALKAQNATYPIAVVSATEYTASDVRDAFSFSEDAKAQNVIPTGLSRTRGGAATGYVFRGFTTSPGKAETLVDEGWLADAANNPDALLPSGANPKRLYALWEAQSYMVELEASAYAGFAFADCLQEVASDRTELVDAAYDEPLAGPIDVPEMKGYVFLGYFDAPQTTAALSDGAYEPVGMTMFYDRDGNAQASVWTKTDECVLYAHYYQVPYTISFKAGPGVSGSVSPLTVFYGQRLKEITVGTVTKPGSSFQGWQDEFGMLYFDGSGKGANVRFGIGMEPLTSIELAPVWNEKTYSIKWYFNWDYEERNGTKHSWSHETRPGDAAFLSDKDGDYVWMEGLTYGQAIDVPEPMTVAFDFFGWYAQKWPALMHTTADALKDGELFQEQEDGTYAFAPVEDPASTSIVLFASWSMDATRYTITLRTSDHDSWFSNGEREMTLPNTYDPTKEDLSLYAEECIPEAKEAGWKHLGWVEVIGDERVPYTETTVPRGDGNHVFEATFTVAEGAYSILFEKGSQVSGNAPYSPEDKVLMDWDGKRLFNAQTALTDDGEPDAAPLKLPALSREETCGYVFKGWFRAEYKDGVLQFASPEEELTSATGMLDPQDLVNRAGKKSSDLIYLAKWEPKSFEVRYRYSLEDGSHEMAEAAYTPSVVSYDATVVLAEPAFQQTGKTGSIFRRWMSTTATELLPGNGIVVRDLVRAVGADNVVARTEADGTVVNVVWVSAEWARRVWFTVPLKVSIVIDPERPEGTKVGEGYIETNSTDELFVESVAFERIEGETGTSYVLTTKDGDRSRDVRLALKGDDAATPLEMKLHENDSYTGLAGNGLGTLSATQDGEPGRIALAYDLVRKSSTLQFGDFTNLAAIKDVRKADNSHATRELGRVFYTLSLANRTPTA